MRMTAGRSIQMFNNIQTLSRNKSGGTSQNAQKKSLQAMGLNNGSDKLNYFKMYFKKNKTDKESAMINEARKNNPMLDRSIYNAEMSKYYENRSKVENIAKKIAKGQKLTAEEKELIEKHDPELARKAQIAKQEGERIKEQMKNAKSASEKNRIAMQAFTNVVDVYNKSGDKEFAGLLAESVSKAVSDVMKGRFSKAEDNISGVNTIGLLVKVMERESLSPEKANNIKSGLAEILSHKNDKSTSAASHGKNVGTREKFDIKV